MIWLSRRGIDRCGNEVTEVGGQLRFAALGRSELLFELRMPVHVGWMAGQDAANVVERIVFDRMLRSAL